MTLDELKNLIDSGEFHHATYGNFSTLWEGLWIYRRSPTGFRGFDVFGSFLRDDPNLPAAEAMVNKTGYSVGAYGCG